MSETVQITLPNESADHPLQNSEWILNREEGGSLHLVRKAAPLDCYRVWVEAGELTSQLVIFSTSPVDEKSTDILAVFGAFIVYWRKRGVPVRITLNGKSMDYDLRKLFFRNV